MLRIPDQVETAAHDSLCVAVPSPREKREGGNVYEELVLIVCDVKVIYVSYVNKLYFRERASVLLSSRHPDKFVHLLFSFRSLDLFSLNSCLCRALHVVL